MEAPRALAKRSPGKLRSIPPSKIERNPENPRIIFRQEEMESLLVSIDRHGIQVPLSVYQDADIFRLIDGERRWRCAIKLNLPSVPALVQERPSELENLLLMYNIHALREQWDYYTIASKLRRVIDLVQEATGSTPTEVALSEATGLTRGQIRRCRLLLNLPERFQDVLLAELQLPKAQQKISEDFFLEMEKSLKAITRRVPDYVEQLDDIRETLIDKYRRGVISAVTDFRQLAKIATAVDTLGVARRDAQRSLDRIFTKGNTVGIRQEYERSVEFEYDERKAQREAESLRAFFDEVLESDQVASLDNNFVAILKDLFERLKQLLGR